MTTERRLNTAKSVLVVSYFFPPAGGVAAQRISKFVKFLPDYGWSPTIVTASPEAYHNVDISTADYIPRDIEVVRAPFGSVGGKHWIPWVLSASRLASKLALTNRPDVVLATGPPFEAFLIPLRLKTKWGIPYILDYRDPWTIANAPKFHWQSWPSTWRGKVAREWRHRLERKAVANSALLTTVSDPIRLAYEEHLRRAGAGHPAVSVLRSCFDPQEMFNPSTSVSGRRRTSIAHIGSVSPLRSIAPLLHGLAFLFQQNSSLRYQIECQLVGPFDNDADLRLLESYGLRDVVHVRGSVSRTEALEMLARADVLWFDSGLNWSSTVTGKIYEYIAVRKPIVALCHPEGDAFKILESSGLSFICESGQPSDVARSILLALRSAKTIVPNEAFIRQHECGNTVRTLATFLDQVRDRHL